MPGFVSISLQNAALIGIGAYLVERTVSFAWGAFGLFQRGKRFDSLAGRVAIAWQYATMSAHERSLVIQRSYSFEQLKFGEKRANEWVACQSILELLKGLSEEDWDFVRKEIDSFSPHILSYRDLEAAIGIFFGALQEQRGLGLTRRDPPKAVDLVLIKAAKLDGVFARTIAAEAIRKGANLNATDRVGNNALLWSIANAQEAMTALLIRAGIEQGADLNLRGMKGNSALHLLIGKGYRQRSEDGAPYNCLPFVQQLLQAGAHANVLDGDCKNPLHLAALRRDYELCKLLVEHGADKHAIALSDSPSARLSCSYEAACSILAQRVVAFLLDQKAFEDSDNLNNLRRLFAP